VARSKGGWSDAGAPTDPVYRLRTSAPYIAIHQALKRTIAPALFAILFVYLGLAFTSAAISCRNCKFRSRTTNH
jgi:hypothetical protein